MFFGFAAPSGPPGPPPGRGPRPTPNPTGKPGVNPNPKAAPPNMKKQPASGEPIDEFDEEEEDSEVAAVMGDIAPWAVSIVLHAALVLIAIMVVWITIDEVEEEEPIIPIARLSEKPGAPLKMKTTKTPTKTSSSKRTVTKSKKVTNKITSKVKADMSLIGVAGASESKASPFGTSVGAGGPFKAGFFGQGGNAKRIAYVVDASGSLLDTLPFVILELKSSISKLSDAQSFTIVFFTQDKPLEAFRPGLKPATSDNKANVLKWLEEGHVVPQGQASPLEAVKRALGYKPDLIFLLSDNITGGGRFELAQSQLLAEVKKSNKNKTKINTIQFLYPDPLGKIKGMRPTLEMISLESGGLYKFVSGRELGIAQ